MRKGRKMTDDDKGKKGDYDKCTKGDSERG